MPKELRMENLLREIVWYIALGIGFGAVIYQITTQFVPIADPDSVTRFLAYLSLMLLFSMLLTFLWWRGSSTEFAWLTPIRLMVQEHCFVFSLAFFGLLYLICVFLYAKCHWIYNEDRQSYYSLSCIFFLPQIYGALMYLIPPKHISRVIVPGWGIFYWLIRLILIAAFVAAARLQFISNFF